MNISLKEDNHVHSTFSDGKGTIQENIETAKKLNLNKLTLVDHVRKDTDWVMQFVDAVDAEKKKTENKELEIISGLETKILDQDGNLDLPEDYQLADIILIADHQYPGKDGPIHPKEIKKMMQERRASSQEILNGLVDATCNSLYQMSAQKKRLAHLFSILPKMGLEESEVFEYHLQDIADACLQTQSSIEISERWQCPRQKSIDYFYTQGVEICVSTDAHMPSKIGQYSYCQSVLEKMQGEE